MSFRIIHYPSSPLFDQIEVRSQLKVIKPQLNFRITHFPKVTINLAGKVWTEREASDIPFPPSAIASTISLPSTVAFEASRQAEILSVKIINADAATQTVLPEKIVVQNTKEEIVPIESYISLIKGLVNEKIQPALAKLNLHIKDCRLFASMPLRKFSELLLIDLLMFALSGTCSFLQEDFDLIKSLIIENRNDKKYDLKKFIESKLSKKTLHRSECLEMASALKIIFQNEKLANFSLKEFLALQTDAVSPSDVCQVIREIQSEFLKKSIALSNDYIAILKKLFKTQQDYDAILNDKTAINRQKKLIEKTAEYKLNKKEEEKIKYYFQDLISELTKILNFTSSNERYFKRYIKTSKHPDVVNLFVVNRLLKLQKNFIINIDYLFDHGIEQLNKHMDILCYSIPFGLRTEGSEKIYKDYFMISFEIQEKFWLDFSELLKYELTKISALQNSLEIEQLFSLSKAFIEAIRLAFEIQEVHAASSQNDIEKRLKDIKNQMLSKAPVEFHAIIDSIFKFIDNKEVFCNTYQETHKAWLKINKLSSYHDSSEIHANWVEFCCTRKIMFEQFLTKFLNENSEKSNPYLLIEFSQQLRTIYEIPDLEDKKNLVSLIKIVEEKKQQDYIKTFSLNAYSTSKERVIVAFNNWRQLKETLEYLKEIYCIKNTLFGVYFEHYKDQFVQAAQMDYFGLFAVEEMQPVIRKKRRQKEYKKEEERTNCQKSMPLSPPKESKREVIRKRNSNAKAVLTNPTQNVFSPLSQDSPCLKKVLLPAAQDIFTKLTQKLIGGQVVSPLHFELSNEQDVLEIFKYEQAYHLQHIQTSWQLIQAKGFDHFAIRTITTFLLLHIALLEEQALSSRYLKTHTYANHDLRELSEGLSLSCVSTDLFNMTFWVRYYFSKKLWMQTMLPELPKGMILLQKLIEEGIALSSNEIFTYLQTVLTDVCRLHQIPFCESQIQLQGISKLGLCDAQMTASLKRVDNHLSNQKQVLGRLIEKWEQDGMKKLFTLTIKDAYVHLMRFKDILSLLRTDSVPENLSFLASGLYFSASNYAELMLTAIAISKNSEIKSHTLSEYKDVCAFDQFLSEEVTKSKKLIPFLDQLTMKKAVDYPFWVVYRHFGNVSKGVQQLCKAYEQTQQFKQKPQSVRNDAQEVFKKLVKMSQKFSLLVSAFYKYISKLK